MRRREMERERGLQHVAIFVVHPEAHPPDASSPGNRTTFIQLSGKRQAAACTHDLEKDGLTKDNNYCGPFFCPGSVFRVHGHH